MIRKTTEEFVNQAKELHTDKYDYSLVEYINNNTKVKIICIIHGIFEILPVNFLSGSGCKKCAFEKIAKDRKLDYTDFINKCLVIHNNKYDYSIVEYINSYTKIKIICPIHGEFEQTPISHLKGSGCINCGINSSIFKQSMSFSDFVLQSKNKFNDKYDYVKETWVNRTTNIKIICPYHGEFLQKPRNHIRHTTGCPKCKNYRYSSLKRRHFVEKYKEKYCTFYIIRCWNDEEEFYKIGITSKTIKKRFFGIEKMPYKYEILIDIQGQAEKIWDLEYQIKRNFSNKRYNPRKKFNGSKFECFELNPKEFVNLILNEDKLLKSWELNYE